VSWKGGNHGVHMVSADDLLVFNNNSRVSMGGTGSAGGDGSGSSAIEIKLSGKTGSQAWSYKGPSSLQTDVMGDLQRLPNGNTFVGYSTKGAAHEVSSSGTLLREMTWPAGSTFGYIEVRSTLYGPPPR